MRAAICLAVALVAGEGLCGAARGGPADPGDLRGITRDIAYGPLPQQRLDLCRPVSFAGPVPAVVIFHGGGWGGGDKSTFAAACGRFAAAGILAVAANYRLAAGVPGTVWPVQFLDSEAVLTWVAGHAAALGVDRHRICAMGASAGGQLALLAGLPKAVARYGGGPELACSISLSGPADLADLSRTRRPMVANLVGPQGNLAAAAGPASPSTYTAPGAAAALLIYGTGDPVVPFAEATAYEATLARSQVPAWLVRYQGGHVLQGTGAAQRKDAFLLETHFIKTGRLATPPGLSDLR